MAWYIYCVISTVVALYALWLLAFHCYEKERYQREWKKQEVPYILIIVLVGLAFVPILSTIMGLGILLLPVFDSEESRIDSWLYRSPGEKEDEKKEK